MPPPETAVIMALEPLSMTPMLTVSWSTPTNANRQLTPRL